MWSMNTRVLLVLMLAVACDAAVQPNKYYQTVSNHVVDVLAESLDDGIITEAELESAVAISLRLSKKPNPVFSYDDVSRKMAAGVALLENQKLSALDKCVIIMDDIDQIAAYWDRQSGVEKQPANVQQEILTANSKHRKKIDRIQAVLRKKPLSLHRTKATQLASLVFTDEWWAEEQKRALADLRFQVGKRVPEDFWPRFSANYKKEYVIGNMTVAYMTKFSADELDTLLKAGASEPVVLRALVLSPALGWEFSEFITLNMQVAVQDTVAQVTVPEAKAPQQAGPAQGKIDESREALLRKQEERLAEELKKSKGSPPPAEIPENPAPPATK